MRFRDDEIGCKRERRLRQRLRIDDSTTFLPFAAPRTALLQLVLLCICFLPLVYTRHTSNHAVIVSSSRYWFNYRHVVNALAIYDLCRRHGIPDSNIVLMLADDIPGNPRNVKRNGMYSKGVAEDFPGPDKKTLYNATTQIDYRGDDVTVENLQRVLLLASHPDDASASRRLHSDKDSHVLVYFTGHGGDSFFKFQDVEELTATDLGRIFQQMYDLGRYKELLFVADTCQAFTLGDQITAPNVYMLGSSLRDENSYANHADARLGLSVIERYTHAVMEYIDRYGMDRLTLQQALVDHLDFRQQHAHVGYREENCERRMKDVPLRDFFGHVATNVKPNDIHFWSEDEIDAARSSTIASLHVGRDFSSRKKRRLATVVR